MIILNKIRDHSLFEVSFSGEMLNNLVFKIIQNCGTLEREMRITCSDTDQEKPFFKKNDVKIVTKFCKRMVDKTFKANHG